jgi:hypothetical protein
LDGPAWFPSPGNYWWRPDQEWYFDSTVLLPGDVVLFTPRKPTSIQKQIIAYQGGNSPTAAKTRQCTHAAIYVGYDGLSCEAVLPGVRFGNLDDALLTSEILVRRAPDLSLDERRAIAAGAAFYRNRKYGWKALLRARFGNPEAIQRLNGSLGEEARPALICSTLCARALLRGGVSVLPVDGDGTPKLITPALLAETRELLDVPLRKCRVGAGGGTELAAGN